VIPDAETVSALREQLGEIVFGTVFVLIGVVACAIALLRRRSARVFAWLGAWSGMYGARQLLHSPAVLAALPREVQAAVPLVDTLMAFLLLVAAALAWRELSLGGLRVLLLTIAVMGLVVAVAAFGTFAVSGSARALLPYNNLLAVGALAVLLAVVTVPRLSRRFTVLPNQRVLAVGSILFAVEALLTNVSRTLGFRMPRSLGSLGFAVLLFSFGYVAVRRVLASEHRLLSIERELEIARQLQHSILPAGVPDLPSVRIASAYEPMTAVAGDFYEFMPVDPHRAGFLIADVSGHGVPAALIASMIKVAAQSVSDWAPDPGEVLRRLDRLLAGHLRGQLVSAAYLWIDTQDGRARYSAAGHPPLLRWRDGELARIESNGLLFGILPDSGYPVRELDLTAGDRFLLYTDGVVEPENAAGEAFGDRRLEQVLREGRSRPAAELAQCLLAEVARWPPPSTPQQDDITLIVIDILAPASEPQDDPGRPRRVPSA
jgi:sigma-B regulation protein RsbU (phosphoserine phosphatase)